jgi:transglutaminase superfamily protein
MRRIRKLLYLTQSERRLLARTTLLVAAVRIALWTLPLAYVCRSLQQRRAAAPELAVVPVSRLAWAVEVAARRIPGASCLTQALALQYLLARAGRESCVHIGVAKKVSGGFESHAWVECGGEVLIGDNGELARYSPILVLSTES